MSINPGPASQSTLNDYNLDTNNFTYPLSLQVHQDAHTAMGLNIMLAPSGDTNGDTDVIALQALIDANPEATFTLKQGGDYYFNNGVTISGQSINGNGATINRVAQNVTTTTTTIVTGTQNITVANVNGMIVGQKLVLYIDGSNYGYAGINSINGKVINIAAVVTGTLSGTITIANTFYCITATGKGTIFNLYFNDSANYSATGVSTTQKYSRWEVTGAILTKGEMLIQDCRFYNTAMEGIVENAISVTTLGSNIVGGTTVTVTVGDSSIFRVGSYCMAYDSADTTAVLRDYDYRRVTAINSATSITVATPFAKSITSSATTILINATLAGRYVNNVFEQLGGNAIHLSGSNSSVISGNHISGTNLAGESGGIFPHASGQNHQDGCITWSNFCTNTKVFGNFIAGTSLAGCGSLDSADTSGAIIANNVFKDCLANAVKLPYGNTASIIGVSIKDNHITDCGPIYAYSNNSITTGNAASHIISGNTFFGPLTGISLTYVRNCSVTGNILDYNSSATPTSTQVGILAESCMGVNIANNTVLGYYHGILISNGLVGFFGRITVKDNFVAYFYFRGIIMTGLTSLAYDVIADGNTITDIYDGAGGGTVTPGWQASTIPYVDTNNGGVSGIYLNGPKYVARNNYITSSRNGVRGIRCDVASCIIEHNVLSKYSNGGAAIDATSATNLLCRHNVITLGGGATTGTITGVTYAATVTSTNASAIAAYTIDSTQDGNVTIMP